MYYGAVLSPATDRMPHRVGARVCPLVCDGRALTTVSIKSLISEPFDSATSPGLAPFESRSRLSLVRANLDRSKTSSRSKINSGDFFGPREYFYARPIADESAPGSFLSWSDFARSSPWRSFEKRFLRVFVLLILRFYCVCAVRKKYPQYSSLVLTQFC